MAWLVNMSAWLLVSGITISIGVCTEEMSLNVGEIVVMLGYYTNRLLYEQVTIGFTESLRRDYYTWRNEPQADKKEEVLAGKFGHHLLAQGVPATLPNLKRPIILQYQLNVALCQHTICAHKPPFTMKSIRSNVNQ